MKICTSCKQELPSEAFYKNAVTLDGLGSQCKRCDGAGKQVKARENKRRLVDAFGGCCSVCGYSKSLQVLQFHHHEPNKERGVSDLLRNKYEVALAEAKKCILLCSNCHLELHEKERPPLVYGATRRGRSKTVVC